MFWTQGAKVSQESFAPPKPWFSPVQLSSAPVQEDFGALGPKDLLHPLLISWGTFEVRAPVPEPLGRNPKNLKKSPTSSCRSAGSPENAKGGGAKKRGGQNLTRRPPTKNSFQPPSPRYVLPPPYPISLSKSLRNSQNFPQLTSSETIFGGSRKAVSDGPSSRGFAFRYVLPPPFSSAQREKKKQ